MLHQKLFFSVDSGGKYVIMIVSRGIPFDITIRLEKVTVTSAVSDAILFEFVDTLLTFQVRSNNRSFINGYSQNISMDKSVEK